MSRPIEVEAFHAFEAAGWEARAVTYGEFVQRVTEQLAAPVLGAANVGPGTSVLDVGTGPGWLGAAAGGAAVVGVDLAPAMLARSGHPGIEFVHGDAEELPLEDGTFDAAVGCFVIPVSVKLGSGRRR
jgi:ubiquinone/menaquinone biosynthesis C-methylase UbiE